MKNQYAKEYYDSYLQQLDSDYKSTRWFSSPQATLDYQQTKLTIVAALDTAVVDSILEIGPGDGVWTDLFIPRTKKIHLLDQSKEMINRAKKRLENFDQVTFSVADFNTFETTERYDMICAIRCFEYFEDKLGAVKKFNQLLKPGGTLLLVTKNPDHVRTKSIQEKNLHQGQISRSDFTELLRNNGFDVTSVLSATWRIKSKFWLMRFIFKWLHWLHVKTKGFFVLPFLTTQFTESFTYVATKQ